MKAPLSQIAHTRSGDKGDTCNIGVIALDQRDYPVLLREVTAERVKRHFGGLIQGEVERFELPNLAAIVFVAAECVGGGVDDDELYAEVDRRLRHPFMEGRERPDTASEFHQQVILAEAQHPVNAVFQIVGIRAIVGDVNISLAAKKFITRVLAIDAEARNLFRWESKPVATKRRCCLKLLRQ